MELIFLEKKIMVSFEGAESFPAVACDWFGRVPPCEVASILLRTDKNIPNRLGMGMDVF